MKRLQSFLEIDDTDIEQLKNNLPKASAFCLMLGALIWMGLAI